MSEERFDRIEQRLDRIEGDLGAMRGDVHALSQKMGVLHEDTIDKIKALAPDPQALTRKFTEADDKLREELDRRIHPLEVLAREQARRDRDGDG